MGLTDIVSNALRGKDKKTSPSLTKKTSPSLTSKSKTSASLVQSSGTSTQVRPSSRIPANWNKDNWKCVNVIADGKRYEGYLWATGNWVELHLFKHVKIIHGAAKCTGGYYWHQNTKVDEIGVPYYPEYSKHVMSAIINRDRVSYSPQFNKHKSNIDDWIDGTITVSIKKEDIDRWHSWHPDNKFKTVIYERTGFGNKSWDTSNIPSGSTQSNFVPDERWIELNHGTRR